MIDPPALAIALKGDPLAPLDGEARLSYEGGVLTLIHHRARPWGTCKPCSLSPEVISQRLELALEMLRRLSKPGVRK